MIRIGRLLLPILLLVLISCQSNRARVYTEEETAAAFSLLSSDIIEYITITNSGEIPAETLESALPSSFSAYSAILPLYDDVSRTYCEEVSGIVSPIIPSAYPVVEESMAAVAASHPVDLIIGDTAFTEAVRESCEDDVRAVYQSELEKHSEELTAVSSVPYSLFMSVRKAYENLSSVGGGLAVPYPAAFTPSNLSYALSDILFSRIGEAEHALKNKPLSDPDSPYAIFWEV